MTKFKKFTAIILSAAALATNAMGAISASAAYTDDTQIKNFTVPPSIAGTYVELPTSQNGVRAKSNSSSVYLYLKSAPCNISVQAWGLNQANWNAGRKANCTLNGNGASVSAVTLQPFYQYEIWNKIKYVDNHTYDYGYAGLKFCSTSQYNSSTISGAWSPDYAYDPNVRRAY